MPRRPGKGKLGHRDITLSGANGDGLEFQVVSLELLGNVRDGLLELPLDGFQFLTQCDRTGIDPGQEVGGLEIGKRQQQVSEVALRVDRNCRNTVNCGPFQQGQAQACLSAR